ncbi:hypothetical protein [Roseomonas populi]|uniref:SMP-30/Gluconolactonase/LRE-like region domain-containing protein n=1 Tax=Roseomonas populi TaxID=3121582 RepID=A0ABT1XC47_9PROT|nr:hypothetical protein [Roseomonas pecuniae]MCR0985692.1 hypothetical protein [Roseomonas pecuniae]
MQSLRPLLRNVATSMHTEMPQELRGPVVMEWSRANKRGRPANPFLEGLCSDRAGHLYVTGAPHGRIFRISLDGQWTAIAEYDGEPDGQILHPNGERLRIAGYKQVSPPSTWQRGWLARC